jgi:TadE-like protein
MTLDEYKKLTPDERRAFLADNEAKAAARCGLSLEEWRAKEAAGCALGDPRKGIAETRATFEAEHIKEDSARLYGGKTWDGKRWRNSDGSRVVPAPIKPFTPEAIEAARQRAQGIIDRGLQKFKADPGSIPQRSDFPKPAKGAVQIGTDVHSRERRGWVVVKWGNVTGLIKRFTDAGDGVVAVEAAIILPVLLVLMAVSFELGAMQLAKSAVVFATQQAATVQSTGGNPQTSFAGNVASTPASNGTVTCNTTGNVATCTGSANFQNAFAGILGASPTLALAYTATVQVPQ